MIKTAINPWQWQFERNYTQAIEVKNVQSTLYVCTRASTSSEI
ncbi:hypothetical protein ACKLNQ_17670 [Myroides odoratimimus]